MDKKFYEKMEMFTPRVVKVVKSIGRRACGGIVGTYTHGTLRNDVCAIDTKVHQRVN
jgi:hypothetical protein